jgi:hypothetical protein
MAPPHGKKGSNSDKVKDLFEIRDTEAVPKLMKYPLCHAELGSASNKINGL